MKIELKLLDPRITHLEYATADAAAVDLRACSAAGEAMHGDYILGPGQQVTIGTGVAMHLGGMYEEYGAHFVQPAGPGFAALVLPRSGLGRQGITLANSVGLIDPDYQGEIQCILVNRGDAFRIHPLDRIAQLLVLPVVRPEFLIVDAFTAATQRGSDGFGSTGRA